MSSTDSELFNTLEKPVSQDVNNAQDMLGRELMDMELWRNQVQFFSAPGSVPTSQNRNVVLGGLVVVPNGNDISVGEGAMCQYSLALAPALGALDSPYRIAVNRAAVTVPMPVPVSDSWVVVEAQMLAVTTLLQTRDILNPATGNFVPTANVPKQQERQIQFQTVTGAGSVPAFTGGDWIPIAVVFRPNGGGAVTNADLIDIRRIWSSRLGRDNERVPVSGGGGKGMRYGGDASFTVDTTGFCTLNASAYTESGDRIWYSGPFDPTNTEIQDTGFTTLPDRWYYLYLAPFRTSFAPVNAQATGTAGARAKGLLILSAVPPTSGFNSATITPGAPWDLAAGIATGAAKVVAALRRNSTNTGYACCYSNDGRTFVFANPLGGLSTLGFIASPMAADQVVTPGANATPRCADVVLATVNYFGTAAAPAQVAVTVSDPAGGTFYFNPNTVQDDTLDQTFNVEIPRALFLSSSFNVHLNPVPDPASTMTIRCYGWRM